MDNDIKKSVEVTYDAKPHGGSKTPWAIILLSIALIIIFIIIIGTFLLIHRND